MIRTFSQSGDTMVACHFAAGPLPAWPRPVPALHRPGNRAGDGLARAASLPEQGDLRGDPARLHTSSSQHSVLKEERGEGEREEHVEGEEEEQVEEEERGEEQGEEGEREEHVEEEAHVEEHEEEEQEEEEEKRGEEQGEERATMSNSSSGRYTSSSSSPEEVLSRKEECGPLPHNSFLPSVDLEEGEEGGGSLHKHQEDSSFLLQGCPSWERDWVACVRHSPPSSSTKMAAPGRDDQGSRWSGGLPGPPPPGPPGSPCSCSSSSSSDGVLVTFSTIYDRSNLPAATRGPGSPPHHWTSRPEEGAVFLNLQPVLQPAFSPPGGGDRASSAGASRQSPTPPEGPDMRTALATAPNQKYYRLAACELPSQSPSQARTSLTNWLEGTQSPAHHIQHATRSNVIGRLHTEEKEQDPGRSSSARSVAWLDSGGGCHLSARGAATQRDTSSCLNVHTDDQTHCLAAVSQQRCRTSGATAAAIRLPVDQNCGDATAEEGEAMRLAGACSRASAVMRYSKAQRPTSLPIQPLVLPPPCSPLGQQQGPRSGSGGRGSRHPAHHFQPSPPCSQDPSLPPLLLLLHAAPSPDTCSTCSLSPDCSSSRAAWGRAGRTWEPQTPSLGLTHGGSPEPHSVGEGVSLCASSCHDLIYLTPCHAGDGDGAAQTRPSPVPSPGQRTFRLACYHTPAALPQPSHTRQPRPLAFPAPPTKPECVKHHHHHPPVLASVSDISPLPSGLLWAGAGLRKQQTQDLDQDRSPSPDTPYESMSLSHLQRRGRLRCVSLAVELIMAYFGSTRDLELKMRLGNSSLSPTIGVLVLQHLCPAIQNLLEDGIRGHSLDPIVGQCPNHVWRVVEASTKTGLCTRVLHSLASKVSQHPRLTSHGMRLRAFIMGLLNLRVLEFWLSHLQSQQDVVAAHYHSWAFLSVCRGRAWPLYQELLLVLQPLAAMPFDLSLLLEAGPQRVGQACSPIGSPHRQWPSPGRAGGSNLLPMVVSCLGGRREATQDGGRGPERLPRAQTDAGVGQEDGAWPRLPAKGEGGRRWAKLFGAAGGPSVAPGRPRPRPRSRRPSEWLQLDQSHLGILAMWPGKLL